VQRGERIETVTVTDVPARAGKKEWIGLAVLALTSLLVSIDMFVLLLALPHLSVDLHASSAQQLWIVDIYGFMVGGFLITMGTLGDRIGRRKLLLIGGVIFALGSLMAAYSVNPAMLITARALMGIAGATLAPSTLALISTMFRDPKQVGVAIGIWAGCFSIGAIIGPMIGGVMLAHFWWGSVFLLAVPVMVILLVLGPLLLPEYRAPQAGWMDLSSVALSLAAILPIIYGIKELARDGWQPGPIVALVVGLALGVVFVRRQRSLDDPLLDPRLFSNPSITASLVSLLSYGLVGGAGLLFMTQHFQSVENLSPLQSALCLLPGMIGSTISVTTVPVLARRIRPAYLISGGLTLAAISLLVLYTQVTPESGPWPLIVGFTVVSTCGVPSVALCTNLILGSAPPEKAGAAASLSQICNEFGPALGVALLGSVGTAIYRAQLSDHVPAGVPTGALRTARENIAGAVDVAGHLPQQLGNALLAPARQAFTDGLHTVAIILAVVVVGAVAVVLAKLRHIPPTGSAQQDDGPSGSTADETIPAVEEAGA
jgi:DHA2 family multidrug resistance protein-like MFS transporter